MPSRAPGSPAGRPMRRWPRAGRAWPERTRWPAAAGRWRRRGTPARLRAWLEPHKRYPRRARLARAQGTVTLVFVMDRTGSVLESHVARSSGHAALDAEAAAMLARAEPLPPLPAEVPDERLTVTLPVEFLMP
ncbi:MAG: TonB family protein [Geminicoccaceae bacterium]